MSRPERSADECRALLRAAAGDDLAALVAELSEDPRSTVRDAARAAARRIEAVRSEHARLDALLAFERELAAAGAVVIAGVDEVGRGAMAGPVTAAAVVLGEIPPPEGLDDSKRLSPVARERLSELVRASARAFCVTHVEAGVIDRIGIAAATRQAMAGALAGLGVDADRVVVDGLPVGLHPGEHAIAKADSTVACVAAASVIAKVERDGLMRRLAEEHPRWDLATNKGYGTPEHLALMDSHGLSPIHRRSFAPGGGTSRLL